MDDVDLCVLPGDHADDGSPTQYALIRRGLDRLKTPLHVIPGGLKADGNVVRRLLRDHRVMLVDMGHTHYNELANDGTTIFATTQSTGQIEEGPVGFSLVSLNGGGVSWRFKPLRTAWLLAMITSPADHRLVTDGTRPDQVVVGQLTVTARTFGASRISTRRCRINEDPWMNMQRGATRSQWQRTSEAPAQPFTVTVEATDASGNTDADTIVVATPGFHPPDRAADGSDTEAVGAWPERHLLGTRLGPNRNGRQW